MHSCADCKWVMPDGNNGLCTRFPPTVFIKEVLKEDNGQQVPVLVRSSYFPPVHPGWCCGEFQERCRVSVARTMPKPDELSKII